MLRAMRDALSRDRRNICPMVGTHAASEEQILQAMTKREFIVWDGGAYGEGVPRLSAAGEAAVLDASEGPYFTATNTGGYTAEQLSRLNELFQQRLENAPGYKTFRADPTAWKRLMDATSVLCIADFKRQWVK
jgi:hypothetical protein